MKLNTWLLSTLAPLTAMAVLAQDTPPAAPAAPPPAPAAAAASAPTPAPAAVKPKKKASPAKTVVVLTPPGTATVKGTTVNVRGQASFTGEVLGHVQKGDTVTVLEMITMVHPQKGEPAAWAQIAMPAGIPVWIYGRYFASDTKTVKANGVNLRGGPGENYSVVGRLDKGAEVKEIRQEKGWVALEAPTNAYAYVAAELLDIQLAPAPIATAPVPAPTPAPEAPQIVNVTTPAAPVAATNEPAPTPAPPAPAPTPQSEIDQELAALRGHIAATPAPGPAAPADAGVSATNEPVTPRIVTREGFVHRAYNVRAPADFELHDIQTGNLIDYLQPKPEQNFKMYVGTRVTVTGPEGVTARWGRTPVLEVQTVDLMP